jgi:hypothetical protein
MQQFTEDETAVSSENLSGPPSHVFLDMLLTEQRDEDLELLDVDNVSAWFGLYPRQKLANFGFKGGA